MSARPDKRCVFPDCPALAGPAWPGWLPISSSWARSSRRRSGDRSSSSNIGMVSEPLRHLLRVFAVSAHQFGTINDVFRHGFSHFFVGSTGRYGNFLVKREQAEEVAMPS